MLTVSSGFGTIDTSLLVAMGLIGLAFGRWFADVATEAFVQAWSDGTRSSNMTQYVLILTSFGEVRQLRLRDGL